MTIPFSRDEILHSVGVAISGFFGGATAYMACNSFFDAELNTWPRELKLSTVDNQFGTELGFAPHSLPLSEAANSRSSAASPQWQP